MPRLMVPSIGGGTKLMRTFLTGDGEGVCAGEDKGVADSSAGNEGVGVGDSCATTIAAVENAQSMAMRPARFTMESSCIVTPVQVRENVIAPFQVAQKCFINMVCRELIE